MTVRFIEKHPDLFQVRAKQDQGTKLLRYLADVLVNGHPDVPKPDPSRVFQHAVVPSWDQ